jgi:hypothetical protein
MGPHVTIQMIFVSCVNSAKMGSCGTVALSYFGWFTSNVVQQMVQKISSAIFFAWSASSASPVVNIFNIKSEADLSDSTFHLSHYIYMALQSLWTLAAFSVSYTHPSHDPSVRAGEDGSCLRPRGHCDWHICIHIFHWPFWVFVTYIPSYTLVNLIECYMSYFSFLRYDYSSYYAV